jgi:protein TonB
MSRRRRKGNPLLFRIILITLGVHAIVLPILGYFGAFKNIAAAFHKPVEIIVTAPPAQKEKEVAKKQPKAQPKITARANGPKRGEAKGKPLAQRVVAANSNGEGGSNSGPSVLNPDKGAAPGTLLPQPTSTPAKTGGNEGGGSPTPPPARTNNPPETVAKNTAETMPPPPPKPHVPVLTEVAATYSPEPTIPDDLRDSDLDTKVTAQVMVSAEGTPTDVKITQSSGNSELDSLAAETAKKWRFKPATKDGVAVESKVNLHIEFQVQ